MRPMVAPLMMAVALMLPGCDQKAAHEEPVIRPVRSMTITPALQTQSAAVTGTIEARAEAALGFRIAGKLISRAVDVGNPVAAGDVLARLDDADQRNALQAAEADLATAQAQQTEARNAEARKRELLANGNTSQSEYDAALRAMRTADARVAAAEASLRTAKDRVGYTELTADTDGVVTAVGPDPGKVVEAGQMIVRVARPEQREAVFNVATEKIGYLTIGAEGEVSLAGDPGTTAVGHVREISPEADPVTRTHTVRVALTDPPDLMRLGATVLGRLKLAPDAVIELPAAALLETPDGAFVWILDPRDGIVRRRAVAIRRREAGQPAVVTKGLEKGDTVVTAGVHSLEDGQRVRIAGRGEEGSP